MRRHDAVVAGAAIVNLAASIALLLPLREGTIAATLPGHRGDLGSRMRFIQEHASAWAGGWAVWMVATISLLLFFWALHDAVGAEARRVSILALLLAAPGASADLLHDALQATVILDAARAGDRASFATWDRFTVVLGGGVVNLMYGLAGLAMTRALRLAGAPRWLVLQSLAVWVTTLALSAAGFAGHALALVVATALTMTQFVAFAMACAAHLRRRGGVLG
ncbi:MAG: hypothetical protein U0166_23555 [Acidobacteriota bacterium]